MIRYVIQGKTLEERVDALAPKWRAAAARKTGLFRKKRKYEEKSGTWSQVKAVFVELQAGKCGYCERQFGADTQSAIEHDVEHFRPKSSVAGWPPESGGAKYRFRTGSTSSTGYYLLAYNLWNYLVACKKCNSPFKSNHFPIAGEARLPATDDFDLLVQEQPLLIYPIGDRDTDPEELITFQGFEAAPVASRGYKFQRARVTIDFFALNLREELLRERALVIKALYVAVLDLEHKDPLRKRDAQQTVDLVSTERLAHRNCARAYLAVCRDNPPLARQYYEAAIQYIDSITGRTN